VAGLASPCEGAKGKKGVSKGGNDLALNSGSIPTFIGIIPQLSFWVFLVNPKRLLDARHDLAFSNADRTLLR